MPDESAVVSPEANTVEPAAQLAAPTSPVDAEALAAKLELLRRDNATKGETNARLNARLTELERQLRDAETLAKGETQQRLADQGEYKALWQDATRENATLLNRITELEAALQARDADVAAERLRHQALQQVATAGALAPEQLLGLLAPTLRAADTGTPAVVVNGIERPLSDHLAALRAPGSGWDHHFAATGTRGMGSAPTSPIAADVDNPYKTRNLTRILQLEATDPETARRLKAAA